MDQDSSSNAVITVYRAVVMKSKLSIWTMKLFLHTALGSC